MAAMDCLFGARMWKLNVLATDARDRTRLNGGVYKETERMKREWGMERERIYHNKGTIDYNVGLSRIEALNRHQVQGDDYL